jgi:hypothetical protein
MDDDDYDSLSQKHLASIKRDMRISLEDAAVRATHKVMAEYETSAQQEPCGWQFYQDGKWHNGMETSNHRANTEAAGIPVRNVYTTPPAQPADPTGQAPCVRHCEATAFQIVIKNLRGDIERMKAAQRTWVDLTDDEIAAAVSPLYGTNESAFAGLWDDILTARAVLAKSKEKNT